MSQRKSVLLFLIVLAVLAALFIINMNSVGATAGCDYYIQHPPSPEHPDGWGECMYYTPTPTEPTVTPTTVTPEPTQEVTDVPSPTPSITDEPTETPTPVVTETGTPTDPTTTPVAPTPVPTQAKHTCEHKCIYQLGGIPGTHAVTAVSPNGQGPYTWQVKFGNVWYDIYDCYGVVIETTAESRGTTSIVRLTVDGTAPTDPNSYRISGGAAAIVFDDFSY